MALTENQDYTVDYMLGRVTIINQGILNSGVPIKISLENNAPEAGAYISYRKVSGRMVLEPSVRFQTYSSVGKGTVEPRLSAKYNLTDHTANKK